MRFPIGAMSVGDILDRGLKVLLTRLPTFYTISLVTQAPFLVYQLLMPELFGLRRLGDTSAAMPVASTLGIFLAAILTIVVRPIGMAATLHIIAREFVNERVSMGAAFGFALRRFLSLLWVSILMVVVITVGFFLCLFPGILFYVWYVFAAQVVVVENIKGMKALDRSKALTAGFRWRVLGVVILILVLRAVLNYGVGILQQFAFPQYEFVLTDDGGMRVIFNYRNYILGIVLLYLVSILSESFGFVCFTLFYFDLRIRKEGYDLELAAMADMPSVEPVPPEELRG